jgi:DNA (cytosine-5)-methyltransferase 1
VNENPTHLDLFSGIGGFALAAGWAGFETVGFCDNEPYAQAVLKKHWPNVPIHGDIKTLDGTAYRGVTLLTGGFPCQPFSNAGKRRGKDDDRYLWPQMLRVIQEARPDWIVGENVVGIIGLALDQVCSDLEAEGYEVEPIIIPACGVDAPHRRNRVWIIAGGGDVADSTDTKWRARQLGETLAAIGTSRNDKSLGFCSGRPQKPTRFIQ